MAIHNFQRTTYSLVSIIYYRAHHHGWAWNSFQNRRSQTAGFCKSISEESNATNLLSRIYRKCIRSSFVSKIYYVPTMVGQQKNFQNVSSH